MYSFKTISSIVNKISQLNLTRCQDSSEYILGAIINNWDDSQFIEQVPSEWLFNAKLVGKRYHSVKPNLDFFKSIINKEGIMVIELTISTLNSDQSDEHQFVVINTDNGLFIADSYIYQRNAELRIFNWKQFEDLIMCPTLTNWCQLFNCRTNINDPLVIDEIEFEYADPDNGGCLWVDDILVLH